MNQSILGKTLQNGGAGGGRRRVTDAIAAALHREFGGTPSSVKTVVALTGATERAVRNWFDAKNGPSGEYVVSLCEHSDVVFEAVLL